jgi:Tfp pilus assembly protein PilP
MWAGAFVFLASVAVAALAQSQAPARPLPASPAAATPQAPPYSYSPDGRRDPFVSLLRRGTETGRTQGRAAEGVAGMLVNELVLKGIMQSRTHYVALVQGPDNKTHVVRVNDRLADGSVRAITADTMVLMQDVNDPLSATKQREVRKTLRAPVEQK